MKLKALLCAGLMLATSIVIPSEVYAETTYASASELITDAIEVAVTGVTSTTYDTAISNMQGKITMSGDMVSYDGTPIGYWYSDDSDTIWSDSGRTSTVLTPTDDGVWEFKPTVLQDILTDFNNDLIENIVPTTEDWSKIIGKYDVTFGDITIPANQWVPIDNTVTYFDLTKTTGVYGKQDLVVGSKDRSIIVMSYAIKDGKLYLSDTMYSFSGIDSYSPCIYHKYANASNFYHGDSQYNYLVYGFGDSYGSTPYITIHLTGVGNAIRPMPTYYNNATMSQGKEMTTIAGYQKPSNDLMLNVNNVSDLLSEPGMNCELKGLIWFETTPIIQDSTSNTTYQSHNKMFDSVQSSKKQIGNTLLRQRLSKFSALTTDDTVAVSSTGWAVIGLGGEEKNFDTYLGTQGILNAGDTADIAAVADAEALAFYVVAPTSLPVYMDSKGEISVATNASIENKSAASVTLTSVQIEPKDDSGWTMVQTTPSRKRDANEFTFSTSLVADTAIDTGAEHPFTYAVDLSPTTEGFESLDLASVLVTVDWTEVT